MKSECLIAEIGLIVISGTARGADGIFYWLTAYVYLGAFYPAGMWVAIILGFVVHLSAKGLWIGIVSWVSSLSCFYHAFPRNWLHKPAKAGNKGKRVTIGKKTRRKIFSKN